MRTLPLTIAVMIVFSCSAMAANIPDATPKSDKQAVDAPTSTSKDDKHADDKRTEDKQTSDVSDAVSKDSKHATDISDIVKDSKPAPSNPDPTSNDDRRIKLLPYEETSVYTITTRYGYQTNIVFAPNEEVETISVGDRSPWQIIPAGNRIFIRPMEEEVITNMTVLTNKHSYQFDLKSLGSDKPEGNIYVAQFVYKDNRKSPPPYAGTPATYGNYPAAPPPMVATGNAPSAPPATPGHPNYNYTYAGADALAPLQVYDDGQFTYIKYPSMLDPIPSVFIVSPSGVEMPANFNVNDNVLRIQGIAPQITLKNKENTVHIFNENLNPV